MFIARIESIEDIFNPDFNIEQQFKETFCLIEEGVQYLAFSEQNDIFLINDYSVIYNLGNFDFFQKFKTLHKT